MTVTEKFLSEMIAPKTKNEILDNIAKHYGISRQEAYEEVVDDDAENLLDYLVEPIRSATSVLMQRHGVR